MKSGLYRNIVIATDGSENTQRAIAYGIKFAKFSGATVHALHVIDTYSLSQSWTVGWETMYEILKTRGRKPSLKLKSTERPLE